MKKSDIIVEFESKKGLQTERDLEGKHCDIEKLYL